VLRGPLHCSPIKTQCVLRVPLHFHKLKGCRVAGPAALFTKNRNSSMLEVPLCSSQMERTVCCGSLCTKGPCFEGFRCTIQTLFKGHVLRGPRHYSQTEMTVCCGSRCTIHKRKGKCVRVHTELFTDEKDCVMRAHGTIHKWKGPCVAGPAALFKTARTVCCEAHGTIHKRKGPCVAGPSALFTNGKDSVLRGPRHYSQMERTVRCGAHGTIHI
jgi:hypothetical protein